MSDTVDLMIRARFDAVASSLDDRDWNDVLSRAGLSVEPSADRRSQRRTAFRWRTAARLALVTAVILLVVALTAVAFGGPQKFIDFFSSPSPTNIKKSFFSYDNATAPRGMNPHAIPGETRKIMTASFDGSGRSADHPTLHTLYVAPREGGGYCQLWTDATGGCVWAGNNSAEGRAVGPLDVTTYGSPHPLVITGDLHVGPAQTVEARFADGTTATIPVAWVSAPIDAGFFVYTVPAAHRATGDQLQSVVALDANGNVVDRQSESFPDPNYLGKAVTRMLPDGTRALLPRAADLRKARELLTRTKAGKHFYLWGVPVPGGGVCYVYFNQTEMCHPSYPPFYGQLYGGDGRVVFYGQVDPQVATVELHYQDGATERLTPGDGFAARSIGPAHYEPGTRLIAAVALSSNGKTILTQHFGTKYAAVYP